MERSRKVTKGLESCLKWYSLYIVDLRDPKGLEIFKKNILRLCF